MTYLAPDLSLDVVLIEQTSAPPDLSAEVVLCAPDAPSANLDIAATAALQPTADLSLNTFETSGGYAPPPLSVLITLKEQVLPPPIPLDVTLCKPVSNGNDVQAAIAANAQLNAVANADLTVLQPEPVAVTVSATASLAPTINADISAEAYVVGISAIAKATLQPTASASMTYDVNVYRGMMRDVSSDLQQSRLAGQSGSDKFESASLDALKIDTHAQSAKITSINKTGFFESNVRLNTAKKSRFESSKIIGTDSESLSESLRYIADKNTLKNEAAKLAGHSDWLSFEAMAYRQIERIIKADYGQLIGERLDTASEYNVLVGQKLTSLAESARLPFSITRYIPPELWQTVILKKQDGTAPPLDVMLCKPPAYVRVSSNLTIDALANLTPSAALSLSVGDAGSAYGSGVIFVTNSVSLTRTDDGRNINLFDFSVGIDSNSYCWTFSASVPLAELSKVNTANEARIGVDLMVNGHLWRFILDGCDDTIAFGERSLSIKGKSRAMLLANPYATHRGFKFDTPLSARQIADAELNRNGVPSGFTLDWDLVGANGWNVPVNTYSYSNRTPINSLQWIAEAAGGFINSDMSADIIHVKELYKIPSWEWSAQTPLLTLPQSLILNRSQNRINKPSYNGVQVWGEREGSVGALVKRTGTAGSYAPPMVTSDLITTNDVARSRGIAILSDTGDMADVSITMPLHADFGILKPATLIGVNDGEQWVGMVRGTSIKGKLSSQQTLEIEQSLSIERHFEGV